jgi:DNA repair exonuclease SbcCD ATPase subunit
MKRTIIVLLVIVGVANLAALYYMIKRQESAFKRIEEAAGKDIEERWQIAQKVRSEIETKKQAREFIERMDYDKQVEDYSQKLDGLKAALDESDKQTRERITALETGHSQLNELTKQLSSQSDTKIESLRKELEALNEKNDQALNDLKAANKQVKGSLIKIESFFDRKISSLEKQLAKLTEELMALNTNNTQSQAVSK